MAPGPQTELRAQLRPHDPQPAVQPRPEQALAREELVPQPEVRRAEQRLQMEQRLDPIQKGYLALFVKPEVSITQVQPTPTTSTFEKVMARHETMQNAGFEESAAALQNVVTSHPVGRPNHSAAASALQNVEGLGIFLSSKKCKFINQVVY